MKTIKIEGNSKVVEFYDNNANLKRVILPKDDTDTSLGLPYGLPFAVNLKRKGVNDNIAMKIENELHNNGIWTAEDVLQNGNRVRNSVTKVYSLDVNDIVLLAKQELRRKDNE